MIRPVEGTVAHKSLMPPGCNRHMSPAQVLDYLSVTAKRALLAMGHEILAGKLMDALDAARSRMDTGITVLAEDAGMSPATLQAGINAAFDRLNTQVLLDIIRMPDKAFHTWASPGTMLAITGGRLPDPALTVLVTALMLRIPVLIKPPSAHADFTRVLVSAIQEADPDIGACIGMLDLSGRSPELQEYIRLSQQVMVFGDDETVARVRAARPGRPVIGFGHREAVEVVMGTCTDKVFDAIARDICMYDQAGCLSPHVVALHRDAMPVGTFSRRLYKSIRAWEQRLPTGKITLDDLAGGRIFIQDLKKRGGHLVERDNIFPNVAFDISRPFHSGPGNRFVQVLTFSDPDDLYSLLAPLHGHIQAFAVHPDPGDLVPWLRQHPVCAGAWLTRPGTLQSPPLTWPEDGSFMGLELAIPLMVGDGD